jgi:hypothetical protein
MDADIIDDVSQAVAISLAKGNYTHCCKLWLEELPEYTQFIVLRVAARKNPDVVATDLFGEWVSLHGDLVLQLCGDLESVEYLKSRVDTDALARAANLQR